MSGIKSLVIDAENILPSRSGSTMTLNNTLTETPISPATGQKIRYLRELSYLIEERAVMKYEILAWGPLPSATPLSTSTTTKTDSLQT